MLALLLLLALTAAVTPTDSESHDWLRPCSVHPAEMLLMPPTRAPPTPCSPSRRVPDRRPRCHRSVDRTVTGTLAPATVAVAVADIAVTILRSGPQTVRIHHGSGKQHADAHSHAHAHATNTGVGTSAARAIATAVTAAAAAATEGATNGAMAAIEPTGGVQCTSVLPARCYSAVKNEVRRRRGRSRTRSKANGDATVRPPL